MKTNFSSESLRLSNPFYKRIGNMESILKVGEKTKNSIHIKKDILEISDEGMLKLKLRNLKHADTLEQRRDEYKNTLEQRLKTFQDAQDTIQIARDLIRESMKEHISSEEKEEIVAEAKEILESIQSIVDEAVKNSERYNIKTTEDQSSIDAENMESENIEANKSSIDFKDMDIENIKNENVETDKSSIDFKGIDIENSPLEALMALAGASEALMEEIIKIQEQISMLEKNIEKMLGEYVEKRDRKSVENTNPIEEPSEDKKDTSED